MTNNNNQQQQQPLSELEKMKQQIDKVEASIEEYENLIKEERKKGDKADKEDIKRWENLMIELLNKEKRLSAQQPVVKRTKNNSGEVEIEYWSDLLTHLCQNFNQNNHSIAANQIIPLPSELPFTFGLDSATKNIFVRQCYVDYLTFVRKLSDSGKYIWLRGSPGIGKSVFSHLLVCYFILNGKIVRFLNAKMEKNLPNGIAVNWKTDKANVCDIADIPHKTLSSIDCVNIYDGIDPSFYSRNNFVTILISSPGFPPKDYVTQELSIFMYFPPWTYEEVLEYNKTLQKDEKDIKERFALYGGSLRSIVNGDVDNFTSAANSSDLHQLKKNLKEFGSNVYRYVKVSEPNDIWDRFLHIMPINDTFDSAEKFTASNFQRRFCSKKIASIMINSENLKSAQEVQQILSTSPHSFQAYLLEGYVSRYFQLKGTIDDFDVTDLTTQNLQNTSIPKFDVSCEFLTAYSVQTMQDELTTKQKKFGDNDSYYIQFTKCNQESVDAVYVSKKRWLLFQFTISDTHELKYNGLSDVMDAMVKMYPIECKSIQGGGKETTIPTVVIFVASNIALGESGKHISARQTFGKEPNNFAKFKKEWIEKLPQYLFKI